MQRLSRGAQEFMKRLFIIFLSCVCVALVEAKYKRNPRETNLFNFIRLVVLRLVFGVGKVLGLEGPLSEFADGALVPPGADDDYSFSDYDRDYSSYDDY